MTRHFTTETFNDPLGNRLRMNRVKFPFVGGQFGDGSYVKYAYDKTSQLLSEKMFLANDTEFLKQEVPAAGGYDAAGNRLQYNITDHGIEKQIASSYDEANQINARNVSFPSIPDQQWQTTFAHDFRGNTTQKVQPAGAGQEAVTWDYTFNIFNKLTKLEKTKLGVKTECGFKYGADGYRVEKELAGGAGVSPVKRLYILDGVHVILEKEIVGEGEPVTKVRYIPGVCMITKDNEANEVIRYYHEDALGSFIAMTDEHQNLTALYQYDAWGNELLPQVSALSPQPSENPYRWCGTWGYYWDSESQLFLLGMRWYDSETGRFVSRDPIEFDGGDVNLNRYVWNCPIRIVDPRGFQGGQLDQLREEVITCIKNYASGAIVRTAQVARPNVGRTVAGAVFLFGGVLAVLFAPNIPVKIVGGVAAVGGALILAIKPQTVLNQGQQARQKLLLQLGDCILDAKLKALIAGLKEEDINDVIAAELAGEEFVELLEVLKEPFFIPENP
jgi:RHS repeat-associated protein